MMLLCKIKWGNRFWALPFLTALAPSERYCEQHAKHHKTITDWACQMIGQLHRWLPGKSLVVVAHSSYAALELLGAVGGYVSLITRLRLDGALFDLAPARKPGQMGRTKVKGARQPSLAQRLEGIGLRWKTIQIAKWYNEVDKKVQVASGISIGYRAGKPAVPIRWVLIKDGQRDKKPVKLHHIDEPRLLALYVAYSKPDALPDQKAAALEEGDNSYEKGAFKDAITGYEAVIASIEVKVRGQGEIDKQIVFYAYYYKAQSYLVIDSVASAIPDLYQAVANSPDSYWKSKAQWYLAMALLKTGEVEKATVRLKQVSSNTQSGEYRQKAKEVLSILDRENKRSSGK